MHPVALFEQDIVLVVMTDSNIRGGLNNPPSFGITRPAQVFMWERL